MNSIKNEIQSSMIQLAISVQEVSDKSLNDIINDIEAKYIKVKKATGFGKA
ncbi:MAG: hypothetical protein Q8942_14070 [Bacillota bacterium]|nr:hypothetical protein [Bacillota bacterium]